MGFRNFIDTMSADTSLKFVIHLGDIKRGGPCTDAYITWIRDMFKAYAGALACMIGNSRTHLEDGLRSRFHKTNSGSCPLC